MIPAGEDQQFEMLLFYLKTERGFDFTVYRTSGLMRRIRKRMSEVNVGTFDDYAQYLDSHPGEFTPLFNTILINVTSFFRDPPSWEYLGAHVIPQILKGKGTEDSIQCWCAGCASGEEVYTLAIVLAETLGLEASKHRVKIYATDVDSEALAQARQATYRADALAPVSAGMRERYFELVEGRYQVRRELRRMLIFGNHNVALDAPIAHLDLLLCRNTLMYFNTQTQARILERFCYALNDHGFLFVGKAEMLLSHTDRLIALHPKHRIYRKGPQTKVAERRGVPPEMYQHLEKVSKFLVQAGPLSHAAFDIEPVAQVVLDRNHIVTHINERARSLFSLSAQDLGRPLQDLELSHRPVELLSHLTRLDVEHNPIHLTNVGYTSPSGETFSLDVELLPLRDKGGSCIGVSIFFQDMTLYHRLRKEQENSVQELATAYEELDATNEELQSTNEELQTSNEEIQSANEELETTNEELQSSNEQLQSTNEELEASNEELRTTNEQLLQRGEELNKLNSFLQSVLESIRAGGVVLDRSLNVQKWNHNAERMWGLRQEEAYGQHFLKLNIGLPLEGMKGPLRACLAGETPHQEVVLDAVNRLGKAIRCRLSCSPLLGPGKLIHGVLVLMEAET